MPNQHPPITAVVERPQTRAGPNESSPPPPVPSKDINRRKSKSNMSFSERKAQQVSGPQTTSSDSDTVKLRPSKPISTEDNDGNNDTNQDQIQSLNKIMRDIDRPPPGDVVTAGPKRVSKLSSSSKRASMAELPRQKSNLNFWEGAFSISEVSPAKERIRGDAIVMAEVKTNVIISDEFTFITELSYHLSSRYQRPVSSIVVTLHHGACMLFGGTFDPAYVISVSALPSHLQPTTNKRNAALIQKHLEEAIGVNPSRGLLKFVPVPEDCLASGGITVSGEMEMAEKGVISGDGLPLSKTFMPGGTETKEGESILSMKKSRGRMKLNVKKSLANFKQATAAVPEPEPTDLRHTQQTQTKTQARDHSHRHRHGEVTPPTSADDSPLPVPERTSSHSSPRRGGNLPTTETRGHFEYPTRNEPITGITSAVQQQQHQPKKRKSFVSTIFSRSSSRAERRDGRTTVLPTIMSDRSL
ncbi:hypothetical protein SMACR_06447 [Sordaria macrospora]|uniref:L-dopachrome isomerase n=1 Tax=Sordaria macrospora TaxID=5147 RepID=A0A8S8ZJX6_SORMA|nr:hypothetical protein SMACR_06447 [Sordaria macrospora]WPJ63053.1 hypothetical protein SMAC4_06447 [Sordaria macrospora]